MSETRWGAELEWMFMWAAADIGERSTFPDLDTPMGSGSSEVVTPTQDQCSAARKQRRIRRVLLTLSQEHQAVLETAYGSARDTPANLAARFGISRRGAVVAWSMQRALSKLGRKVTSAVCEEAQRALDEAHVLYGEARKADQCARPNAYPRHRAHDRRDRVQAFRDMVDGLVA